MRNAIFFLLVTILGVTNGMGKRINYPVRLGGEWTVGDAGAIPEGNVRSLENILTRPGRYPARAPFLYDNLMAISGLANWDDSTNKVTRLFAVDTSEATYAKSATVNTETWSSTLGTISAGKRLSDYANYRGTLYGMLDGGATGLPTAAFSYDGTTLNSSPFNSAIQARTVTTFLDRLYLGYPRVTVTPLKESFAIGDDYNWGTGGLYSLSALNTTSIVANSTTTCRIYPTSTTASYMASGTNSLTSVTGPVVWRQDLRNTSSTYDLPFKMEIGVDTAWASGHAYVVGDVVVSARFGNRHVCITAGTSGGGAPSWATTVGASTTDNSVTWRMEGTWAFGTYEGTLLADPTTWSTFYCAGTMFVSTNAQVFDFRFSFGNSATPTIALNAIDVSYKDGIANGAPGKANKGTQFTVGDYYYPFCNVEPFAAATVDLPSVVWSEIADAKTIKAANTYNLIESPGYATAATSIGGRLLIFKRNAFWQFQGTNDPDNPIRREVLNLNIGCIGPRALDTYEDVLYFIGESDIYSYQVGGSITPITGDGMRETIMAKGSNWVETQSTYNRPLLAIDKSRLILWVYTQKGTLYSYDLRSQQWSTHYTSLNNEVDAMLWNANTGNFYVSWGGYGLTLMNYGSTANDTIDNTANTYAGTMAITLRPIEISSETAMSMNYVAGRWDATLERIRLMYSSTITQTGQTVTAKYSYDQGSTFPNTIVVTPAGATAAGEFKPLPLETWESGPTLTVRIERAGELGENAWTIGPRAWAEMNLRRGEFPATNPTAGSASL